MQTAPLVRAAKAATLSGLSEPTVRSCLKLLIDLGIAQEVSGKRRDRLYTYAPYLKLLEEGTEPISPRSSRT